VSVKILILIGGLAWVCLVANAAAAAYEETVVRDGGTVTGVVKFVGPPPRLAPLRVNKNWDVCGQEKPSEALVLGSERGVKGSVVMIEGITHGKRGTGEVIVDNHKCLFVTHVTAAMPGVRARVKNSDPILHNTHGFLGKPTVFNLALPHRHQMVDITKRLTRPGVVRVICDAHPHMFAWMILHENPYVAVTNERGAFRIDQVPPGTYKVTMWHEGFRQRGADKDGRPTYDDPQAVTKEIKVGPAATTTVDFELR